MGDNNGISGGIDTTLPIAMTLSAFTAIAWCNCVELNILIFMTFKKRRGLYFYSLIASSWGILVYALAFLMKFFQVWKNDYLSVALITIGWYAMVTGQSLVLYSRLHLVVRNRSKIKWVLYMIIIDAILFHFPTTVLTFGSNSPMAATFVFPYSIMEKIQVTAFAIQEFIISGLYLYETRRILKPTSAFQKRRTRQVMLHLIYVNVLIILMDITLLCTEYANLYEIQITFKGAVYSVKLRLEFAVLNQLISLTAKNNNIDLSLSGTRNGRGDETAHNATTDERPTASAQPARSSTYSVFAGTANHTYFPGDIKDNSVMKTTEINVQRDIKQTGKNQDGIGIAVTDPEYPKIPRPSASATSSEVEFAAAGF